MDKAELQQVEENCPMDAFENAIRRIGVVAACEWFGHRPDSDFTAETIRVLAERTRHCMCEACEDGTIHASDCAVHNEPAMRNGPCDCGVRPNAKSEGADAALSRTLPLD